MKENYTYLLHTKIRYIKLFNPSPLSTTKSQKISLAKVIHVYMCYIQCKHMQLYGMFASQYLDKKEHV